mmetsp:Transcript_20221/g.49100  ORF Transcript_20221/g.49100 Transcript_20221/m.49100 type:complete len:224 (-) Transcript_20221:565-1236(-)
MRGRMEGPADGASTWREGAVLRQSLWCLAARREDRTRFRASRNAWRTGWSLMMSSCHRGMVDDRTHTGDSTGDTTLNRMLVAVCFALTRTTWPTLSTCTSSSHCTHCRQPALPSEVWPMSAATTSAACLGKLWARRVDWAVWREKDRRMACTGPGVVTAMSSSAVRAVRGSASSSCSSGASKSNEKTSVGFETILMCCPSPPRVQSMSTASPLGPHSRSLTAE